MKALKAVKGLDVSDAVDAEFWLDCTEVLEPPASSFGHGQSSADPAAAILQPSSNDTEFPDGRVVNNEAIYRIRRKYVSDRLRDCQESFVNPLPLTVFCGTFNVNGKKEAGAQLNSWLKWHEDPDIYVIGFQEIVDLNAVNVAMSDSKSQQRSMLWRELIDEYLVSLKTPYRCVAQQNLVGVLMFVYVKTKHCDSAVKNVQ
eukprot:3261-Heterococcus_DN1.PRE.2